jgi:hypothetical protein
MSEVRFIRNTTDADAQMVGNESTDVAGGQEFFDSCCLFTWCQATDHHHKPPNSLNALGMRPSNPPRNVALFKNLESVAIAPQFLEASRRSLKFDALTSNRNTTTYEFFKSSRLAAPQMSQSFFITHEWTQEPLPMRESLESQIPDTAPHIEWLAFVCAIVVAVLFCAVLFSTGVLT